MAVRVTIEARSRTAAEVVAQHLGAPAQPRVRRGLSVIHLMAENSAESAGIVDKVSRLLEEHHDLGWVRVRYEDESRVFRSNRLKTA
jgi:hypothetical protein